MAKLISLVVFEADGVPLKTSKTLVFSTGKFIVYPYRGTNNSLKSTIEITADYTKKFSVSETLNDIIALAN
jgi:hypothetical protein